MSDGCEPLVLKPCGEVQNEKVLNISLDVQGNNFIGHFQLEGKILFLMSNIVQNLSLCSGPFPAFQNYI